MIILFRGKCFAVIVSLFIVLLCVGCSGESEGSGEENPDLIDAVIDEIPNYTVEVDDLETDVPEIQDIEPEPPDEPDVSVDPGEQNEPIEPDEPDVLSTNIEPSVADISETEPELSDRLDIVAKKYNCATVSLVAYDSGDSYFTYLYDCMSSDTRRAVDTDTKFRVASLSKLVTVICAMILVDAGEIDLDEDISVYLGYEVRNPSFPDEAITARMLMQHTSSIYDSESFGASRSKNGATDKSTRDLLEAQGSFSGNKPGARYRYSNFGIAVLGAVCEMVSGEILDLFAREALFSPLDIDAAYLPSNLHDTENIATIYNANHGVGRSVQAQLDMGTSNELGYDHHLAQGNLTISAIDYARLLTMLVNGGTLGDVRILTEESVREIHITDVNAGQYKQGLAVRYNESTLMGDDVYWHTGSMHGEFTQFSYNLENGRIIVVLTTGANGERASNGMLKACEDMGAVLLSF